MKKIIFLPKYDYDQIIYGSLAKNKDIIFAGADYIPNPVLRWLNKLHTSYKTNKRLRLPFQWIWYPIYLFHLELRKKEKIIFIFIETSKLGYEFPYLRYLRKKYPNASIIFRCENSSNYITCPYLPKYENTECLYLIEKYYHKIVTFDKNDAKKYGWLYFPNSYYGIPIQNVNKALESDVLFIGRSKGRLKELVRIYDYLTQCQIKCLFFIAEAEEKIKRKGIQYIKKPMSYYNYLQYVYNTKCILEVLADKQTGNSLRLGEAIFYNKYLLTNAKDVKELGLYSPKYVSIFQEVESIDLSFIKNKIPVNLTDKVKCMEPKFFIDYLESIIR